VSSFSSSNKGKIIQKVYVKGERDPFGRMQARGCGPSLSAGFLRVVQLETPGSPASTFPRVKNTIKMALLKQTSTRTIQPENKLGNEETRKRKRQY